MEVEKVERKERKDERKEEIIARKLRFTENPSSIVIAPKTKEGHMLTKILMGFDRAVSRIRIWAGSYIGLQEAIEILKKGNEFIAYFREVTNYLGDGGERTFFVTSTYQEDQETKKMLARRITTYVVLPKTSEGKELALLLKRFDPLLLQFRSSCSDFTKSEEVFKKIVEMIFKFDALTRELSGFIKIRYESPKGLGTFENYMAQLGEVVPKKGKKVGGIA